MIQKKVLIVDDDALFCWALQRELTCHRMNAFIANTGRECIEAMNANRFDLFFIDIHLPDVNGLDLLKSIRKVSPESRVVVVSGDGSDRNKRSALSAGAEQFLEKPFDISVIKRFVSSAFREESSLRKHSRYFCSFPLRFSVLSPSLGEEQFFLGSMQGNAEDVGREGIRVTTDYPLRTGQGVRLRVDGEMDPFSGMVPGEGCAEVVWAVSRGNQSTAGLRFLPQQRISA